MWIRVAGWIEKGEPVKPILAALLFIGTALLGAALLISRPMTTAASVQQAVASFTQRLSDAADGAQGNGSSTNPSISGDGARVAFLSSATNLTDATLNGNFHVFVKDRPSGALWLASQSDDGVPANANADAPRLSGNGRFVVFASPASNLVEEDTNGVSQVYARDLLAGRTFLLSRSDGGAADVDATQPDVSASGRFVVFASAAGNLTFEDFNGLSDIFVHDRDADGNGVFDEAGSVSTLLVSSGFAGEVAAGSSFHPAISEDGRYVVFESAAPNLVPGDANGLSDIFLHDRDADGNGVFDESTGVQTILVSQAVGEQGNGDSGRPAISGDGQHVAFESFATNLIPGGSAQFRRHIFAWTQEASRMVLVSASSAGVESNRWSGNPALSGTGRYVVFESSGDNLVAEDTNFSQDIFLRDRDVDGDGLFDEAGQIAIQRVSLTDTSEQMGGGQAFHPDITATGGLVIFDADAANLVVPDYNNGADVFLRRWDTMPSDAEVDLRLAVLGRRPVLGNTALLTVTLTNLGAAPARNLRLLNRVSSAGIGSFVSPGQGAICSLGECQIVDLHASQSITIPLGVYIRSNGPETYQASITVWLEAQRDGDDQNPGDNVQSQFHVDFYRCSDQADGCLLDELFCKLFGLLSVPWVQGRSSHFLPDLALYYHVRNRVLNHSGPGRRIVEQYYAHSDEVSQLVFGDADLQQALLDGLLIWEPTLRALVDGEGESAVITVEQVAALDEFLTAIAAVGSPALQQAIATERANLPAFDSLVGKTVAQARRELVGYDLALPLVQNQE